ncbi:MAG: PD-(D/E)XK nuclease family protein [Opitutaceae bacterium]
MVPPPAAITRHFLPWDGPWLPQAAAWLARDWDRGGPLDLSTTLVVVPTRQSARRLREALAEHAAAFRSAVFPPQSHTPDTLLAAFSPTKGVATPLESRLAWVEVLQRVDLESVAAVFPVAPVRRDFAWAWRTAEVFVRLQTQLTEGGLAFAEVAARATPEAERWTQLAFLENEQAGALARRGRREPHAVRREVPRESGLPVGVRRVVLLGLPDPLALAVDLLAAWSRAIPVDVVIFAPPSEAEAFDGWGRPLPEVWTTRTIALRDFEQRVQACADPAGEAERVVAIARAYAVPDGSVAVGSANPEVLSSLERALGRAGIAAYNPEGRPRKGDGFYALLTVLADLAREPAFATVAALARCPEFFNACAPDERGFSIEKFLKELDDLNARHLPVDLARALTLSVGRDPVLGAGLRKIEVVRTALTEHDFPDSVIAALTLILGGRQFDLGDAGEAIEADALESWREVLSECAAARESFPELRNADWWDLALTTLGESRRATEKPAGALELQGWLELLWEDAPHLIVTGGNDGLVPEAVVGDAFLPESLREALGLKTNAARFARDAYLLQAMAASRANAGRLDLTFARQSSAGDPLRPSRLLLRCADEALPERVAFLFRPLPALRASVPWTRAWPMKPRRVGPPERVAVTGLRAWLACPFRFYLSHVLRMEPVDPAKTELDARDFGTLCHAALEAMGRAPALQDCTDETKLREFLHDELERVARARFGRNLTLPLIVQLESARQRLGRVAALQARERAEGWVALRIEWAFSLQIAGLEVRGKIDRVERHEATGALRVIDYKTSDTATPPQKSHLRAARPEDEPWRRPGGAQDQAWADLQLPLYLRALASEFPDTPLSCGYVNLPKAVSDTALVLWPELNGPLQASANACADHVAAAIRAGVFWPPVEWAARQDDFAALFHHGTEASLVWEGTP